MTFKVLAIIVSYEEIYQLTKILKVEKNNKLEMNITGATPELSPDELTLHLVASGVIKLAEKVKNNQALKLPYEKEIQRGLDRVVLNCLRQGQKPPQGIPDLISWCRKPLVEWFLDLPQDVILPYYKFFDG